MSATRARSGPRSPPPSRLAGLLALAVFINYVDRGNLATAALLSWTLVVSRIAPVAWEVRPRWPALPLPVT
jgi:hypothetical protein